MIWFGTGLKSKDSDVKYLWTASHLAKIIVQPHFPCSAVHLVGNMSLILNSMLKLLDQQPLGGQNHKQILDSVVQQCWNKAL